MRRIYKQLLAFSLIIGMSLSSFHITCVHAEETTEEATVESTDWMAGISDDTYLSSVTIPGTHDSASTYIFPSFFLQCQTQNFSEQLASGYRYLDIRLALDETEDEGTKLKFIHNFGTCKKESSFLQLFSETLYLEDVLEDVYSFLDEHPTETVIFCVKAENTDDDVSTLESKFFETIDKNASKWYTANEIPTLGSVRGKIVLATRFEDVNGEGEGRTGLHFSWSDQNNKEPVIDTQEITMMNDYNQLWVQDRYKYKTETKWDAVVESLENCQARDDTFSLNFCSTSGNGSAGHPKKYARIINKNLLNYELSSQTSYGIIVVDFANESLARHIYSTNF
ncbi:MAG: phosphatidylinositol-specific phospholipase C [Lachnospiraceae bacterium]|nr:phosphatidylinositol-specific phospholipase C [Lachnospiraceae bacterium]